MNLIKNTLKKTRTEKFTFVIFLSTYIFLFSCNKNKKNSHSINDNIPKKIFFKVNILSKENGIKYHIYSPIVKEYKYYTIFPNGFELFIYENNIKNKKNYNSINYIQANWVKITNKIFFHIKGNVKILSKNGYFLNTEEIFWNKKKKIFFNNVFTIISNDNGMVLYSKNGIEACNDLKNITLKNISGIVPIYF